MSRSRRARTVLVVEDDARLRELYRSALVEAGFSVVAVPDGVDALKLLEHRLPAAVVLDLALVRMSGSDVARELRARAPTRRIPIVVVTGTDARAVEGVPVDCILRKPIVPDELVETVERCLRAAR